MGSGLLTDIKHACVAILGSVRLMYLDAPKALYKHLQVPNYLLKSLVEHFSACRDALRMALNLKFLS